MLFKPTQYPAIVVQLSCTHYPGIMSTSYSVFTGRSCTLVIDPDKIECFTYFIILKLLLNVTAELTSCII